MARSAIRQFFWPPVIDGDYLDAARKRCLLVVSIAVAIIGSLSGWRNFDASMAAYPIQTIIAITVPLVFLVCPFLIARTPRVRGIAWFFLAFSYVGIVAVSVIAGGMYSRSALFLLPWAVYATLFLGWKEGVGAAIIVVCTYLVLYSMRGVIAPSVYEMSIDVLSHWLVVGLSMTLVMLITGAAIFQREMEHAATKLCEARTEAESANRAKSDFLAMMSHEIRTPMNGVLGMAEMLEDTELSDQQRLYAETITSSGASLMTIINDILDLSKIEAGHISLTNKPFALRSFIEQISMLFKLRANQQQLDLIIELDENLPDQVSGDAGRIRQILINLIGNALKFTEKGHIKLKVSGAFMTGDVGLSFIVEDTGIGIPEDKLDDIFRKFEQVEGSTTRRYDGAGLGLAISRQLAHAMGGDITAQSVCGEGCTFTFKVTLPVAAAIAPSPVRTRETSVVITRHEDGSPSGTELKTSRIRVLIAEDNDVNRLVIKSMIDAAKYDICFAVNGVKALAAYRASAFDVVLMDVSMPEMDGYEAACAIRNFERETEARHTPIVCVTAHAFEDQREKTIAAGMDDYLSKPIRREQLAAMLSKWTTARGKARDVA
jgi:signal transduction histidine kinase/ActR/RegA family two-component response regulator